MTALLTTGLLALVMGAVVLEGWTIASAARSLRPDGYAVLDRLGARFLITEGWVIALLGVAHAARPTAWHELLAVSAPALVLYGAGWVVRDAGLWLGPRARRRRYFRAMVGAGAVTQAIGVMWGVAEVMGTTRPGASGALWSGEGPSPVETSVLGVLVPACVVLVGGIQLLAWWALGRQWRTPFFAWERDGARASLNPAPRP